MSLTCHRGSAAGWTLFALIHSDQNTRDGHHVVESICTWDGAVRGSGAWMIQRYMMIQSNGNVVHAGDGVPLGRSCACRCRVRWLSIHPVTAHTGIADVCKWSGPSSWRSCKLRWCKEAASACHFPIVASHFFPPFCQSPQYGVMD